MTSPNLNPQSPSLFQQQLHPGMAQPRPQSYMQAQYVQPHYDAASSFVAELPAPLPPAPPTTTSEQQLNQDELLAHKLQNLEVEEARQRSASFSNTRPSQNALHAPSHPNLRHSYNDQSRQSRLHSRSVSSLTPNSRAPFTQPRAVSEHIAPPLTPYGPESFNRPIGIEASDLPEVVVDPFVEVDAPQWEPELSQLPEVVSGPPNGDVFSIPSPTSHPTAHLPSIPEDTTAISKYLEQHRRVPHPIHWMLSPSIATFYGTSIRATKSESWLDTPVSQQWRVNRISEKPPKSAIPAFEFTFKTKCGTFHDPQLLWTMEHSMMSTGKNKKIPHRRQWRYHLRMEPDNKIRKSEHLYDVQSAAGLIPTYIHALNYDSLRFLGPGGRAYKWVSHAPVTAMHGARYDALRHALFMAPDGHSDPLYGIIVADHAYWDGHIDHGETHHNTTCDGCKMRPLQGLRWRCRTCIDPHTVCDSCRAAKQSVKNTCAFALVNLPDETLHIRSDIVDPALVVATLQVLRDWELHTMRAEKAKDPKAFEYSEGRARRGDLGRIRHWRRSDFDKKGRLTMNGEVFGTVVKAREIESAVPPESSAFEASLEKNRLSSAERRSVRDGVSVVS